MRENLRVLYDASLAPFTTFKIGGRAKRLVLTSRRDDLERALGGGEKIFLLGGGSNLLISDSGFDGTVIKFTADAAAEIPDCRGACLDEVNCPWDDGCRIRAAEKDSVCLAAEGGMKLPALASLACRLGLSGLEWAAGIPGTVGGAIKMNAGAHGGDVKSVLVCADVISGGGLKRLNAERLGLGYRSSSFDGAVIKAVFALKRAQPQVIKAERDRLIAQRRAAQPAGRSAGSVYKAACGVPAYKYIDGAGLRGFRIGGAQVSEKHANFIVNTGGATAADVYKLMIKIETEVYCKYGVRLQRELKLVGEF